MAWQLPPTGSWNQGMPSMAPDMSMGSYTPEQWAAVQQQNWQQWTQWQQQYAQWQNQYGGKYAEQMQAMQAMGGMPPLPPGNAPPPAPPPPDKPPPPPHENNQPLFGNKNPQPVPPPTEKRNVNPGNNISVNINQSTDNRSSWSYSDQDPQNSANVEALKKLAEEERLFDIQFKKWEEEIEKWKVDNVNHPDKTAYKEYENKFEACRAQLLERRQQMNQKRAKLTSNAPTSQSSNIQVVGTAPNAPQSVPPLMQQQLQQNKNQNQHNNQHQGQHQNQHQGLHQGQHQGQHQNQHQGQHQNQHQGQHQGQHQNQRQNQHQGQYQNQQQNYNNSNNSQNYNNQGNQYQQQQKSYNMPQRPQNRGPNNIIDTQDRNDSYQKPNESYNNDNYSSPSTANTGFLPTSRPNKGIPGLDLVPDAAAKKQNSGENAPPQQLAPDYTKISKGINNILGDEKIMNILSMVRGQFENSPNSNSPGNIGNNQQAGFGQGNNNNQGYNNQQQQQQNTFNRPPMQQNQQQQMNQFRGPPPNQPMNRMNENRPPNMNQNKDQYNYDRNNMQYGDNSMDSYNNSPSMHGGPPPMRPNMGQNMGQRPPRPNQEMPPNQMPNDFRGPMADRRPLLDNNVNAPPREQLKPKWVDEPLFTPSLIVEYEHKNLRLKARDFIEPVHTFDYNHKSKDGEERRNFDRETDEFFARKSRRPEKESDYGPDRYYRDSHSKDYERRLPRDDYRARVPPRDPYDDRRWPAPDRYDDRPRDDIDKFTRREDSFRDRERLRDDDRERTDRRDLLDDRRDSRIDDYDRGRDVRRPDFDRRDSRDVRNDDRDRGRDARHDDRDRGRGYRDDNDRTRDRRSHERDNQDRNHDRDSRKRGVSKESEISSHSKRSKESPATVMTQTPKRLVMIDDILEPPGRSMRPEKIAIILRGPPGSGKSYLAKLIRDREAYHGGTVRIMSIDDYFMQEGEVIENDPATGKQVKKPTLKYEYDEASEEIYLTSLKRAFKRTVTDGYFPFLIYDAVNETLKTYADIWNYARQNGFQAYVCTMEYDTQTCFKRNIHNRSLDDIQTIATRFFATPAHHIQLDATTLLQSASISEVEMEDADHEVIMEDADDIQEVETVFTSKWEKMDDVTQLARLDGTSKPLRPSQLSMVDYLQLDEWTPNTAKPGKKTVRWADIEERREQEKMRAIGFVVGQTDWNRMTDPTMGSSALTQTKYIERVRRK